MAPRTLFNNGFGCRNKCLLYNCTNLVANKKINLIIKNIDEISKIPNNFVESLDKMIDKKKMVPENVALTR